MRKLLLSACLVSICWTNPAGAMNGYCDDYSYREDGCAHEVYEGDELDISSQGDKSLSCRYGGFPDVESLTADLTSAFRIIYRSPVAACGTREQSLIRWSRFPKVRELVLKSDDEEFLEVSHSLCNMLQYGFGLCVEITEIPRLDTLEELDMSGLNIVAIPESIQNLRNLRTLNLSGNSLEGLPQSIGNLTKLEILDLGSNDADENRNNLPTLPDSIGNLVNLETLDLTDCSLRELPETLGNLRNLKALIVEFNPLTELPESIGNLMSLQTLDLTDCSLQGVPESIGNLKNLEYFYLDDYVILPPTVRNLKKLEPGRLEELEEQIED